MYGYFDQADKANGHNIYRAPDGRMVEVTEISDVLLDRPNAVIVDLSDHSLVHMLGPVMYRGRDPSPRLGPPRSQARMGTLHRGQVCEDP